VPNVSNQVADSNLSHFRALIFGAVYATIVIATATAQVLA
jgi:hypothetical protein